MKDIHQIINKTPRYVSWSYFAISLLLLVYVAWRAANISFSHDESLSYTIITGNDTQMYTANNHWLNTIFMYLSSKIFGYSEFALRLPSLIAFVIYLVFIYRIFTRFSGNWIALLFAVPVLLMNPFILDFFGLARGYGLGMAFFTVGIYYFLAYFLKEQSSRYLLCLILSNVLCIYANYTFFTPILGLHITAFIIYFSTHRDKMKQLAIFYAIELLLLIPAIMNILYLSKKNELYAGGTTGVIADTLKSIAIYSFFDDRLYSPAIYFFSFLIIIALLMRKNRVLNFIKLLVFAMLAIPTLLYFVMEIRYPTDRGAIYWIVIAGILVMFITDWLVRNKPWKIISLAFGGVLAATAILCVVNFRERYNLTYAIIWKYDSDVENMLTSLEKRIGNKDIPSKEKTTLGISWFLEPSINYYRETKNYTWLEPVNRDGVAGNYDFYAGFAEDLEKIDSVCTQKLRYYPLSEMHFLSNCEKSLK